MASPWVVDVVVELAVVVVERVAVVDVVSVDSATVLAVVGSQVLHSTGHAASTSRSAESIPQSVASPSQKTGSTSPLQDFVVVVPVLVAVVERVEVVDVVVLVRVGHSALH